MTATPTVTAAADASSQQQPAHVKPLQGAAAQLEGHLEALLQSLLEMGICTSDVQEAALESTPGGVAFGRPGGLLGLKVNQTVEHLQAAYTMRHSVNDVRIPLDVINAVDQGRNPNLFTRDFVERVAGENMFTNGMLSAVTDYRDMLQAQLAEAFPELAPHLAKSSDGQATNGDVDPTMKAEDD